MFRRRIAPRRGRLHDDLFSETHDAKHPQELFVHVLPYEPRWLVQIRLKGE